MQGYAIECRITAEDPFNGFLPSSGRIIRLFQPSGPGVRVDSGIYEGYEVSLFYDPLLAKLIAWGENREAAIQRMRGALERVPDRWRVDFDSLPPMDTGDMRRSPAGNMIPRLWTISLRLLIRRRENMTIWRPSFPRC